MDSGKLKTELEGLSEAQLKLVIEVTLKWLPGDNLGLVLRLISQMKKVHKEDKGG